MNNDVFSQSDVTCKRYDMTTDYKYISSTDYIAGLSFASIDIYSFQRGQEREQDLKTYTDLRTKKASGLLQKEQLDIFNKLRDKLWLAHLLIDNDGNIHPSAVLTKSFKKDEEMATRIESILKTPIVDIPGWMCAPIYRDAIVFLDNENKILSCLNVCLSCEYMQIGSTTHINADMKSYKLFRDFFIECGHPVETESASR